ANEDYDEKLLVPKDGVEREKSEKYFISGCQLSRHKFDSRMMVEKESLLACTGDTSSESCERIELLKKKAKPLPRSKGMRLEHAEREQLAWLQAESAWRRRSRLDLGATDDLLA